jgi:hypothetical protein
VGLTNLGSELEKCVGSCFHLVGVPISFEKNFYRLPFTPPLSSSPYRSFKRNEWHRRLRESLPIWNLAEALDQVESRVHTTPEQCLMSITTIARQAQGMRAGQVIAKLAEDAYFMRVNNRVTQVPPVRNRQHDNEATSRSANIGRNCT